MISFTTTTCRTFRARTKNVSYAVLDFCEKKGSKDFFSPAVLKTGASGMIAYRFQKKDGEWQWLQTSSRLVYKNSKPDFVICTHRQLMEEEGRDLLGKRTMDFKVKFFDGFVKRSKIYENFPFRLAILTPDYHRHTLPKQTSFSSLRTDLRRQLWATLAWPRQRPEPTDATKPNSGISFQRAARSGKSRTQRACHPLIPWDRVSCRVRHPLSSITSPTRQQSRPHTPTSTRCTRRLPSLTEPPRPRISTWRNQSTRIAFTHRPRTSFINTDCSPADIIPITTITFITIRRIPRHTSRTVSSTLPES